jgi:hypothetical protein
MRRLNDEDRELVRDFYLALSRLDRIFRFGAAVPDSGIDGYVDAMDFENTFIYALFWGRTLVAVAEIHPLRGGDDAEVAMCVGEFARNMHVGTFVFEWCLNRIAMFGKKIARFQIKQANTAMRKIAVAHNAVMRYESTEYDCEIAV